MRKLMLDSNHPEPNERQPALDAALIWDARLVEDAGVMSIVGPETTLSLDGMDMTRCRAFLDRLDGRHSLAQLCDASGLDPRGCEALVACLLDSGLARRSAEPAAAGGALTGPRFAELCRELIPAWKTRLFGHSLWRRLGAGEAPRALFQGWLLENYHLIEGVTLRLSAAAAHCHSDRLRRHFIKHFAEEYDHCEFFRRALRECGLTNAAIDASTPLAGTLAVIHWARDAARSDPLAYAACSAFLESTGEDRRSATEFFQRLADAHGSNVIRPIAQHAQLDEAYGHAGFLETICADIGEIERERAERAIGSLRGFVETLELWSTAMERHYTEGAELGPIPVRIYGALAQEVA